MTNAFNAQPSHKRCFLSEISQKQSNLRFLAPPSNLKNLQRTWQLGQGDRI